MSTLGEKIGEIHDSVLQLTVSLQVIKEDIEQIKRDLDGNGRAGLKDAVVELSKEVAKNDVKIKEIKREHRNLVWLICSIFLLFIVDLFRLVFLK